MSRVLQCSVLFNALVHSLAVAVGQQHAGSHVRREAQTIRAFVEQAQKRQEMLEIVGGQGTADPSTEEMNRHKADKSADFGAVALETENLLGRSYPFYHTSQQMQAKVNEMKQSCGGALSVETKSDSDVSLDVITVRKPGVENAHRFFLLFGEHSRELISPESGLAMLDTLCQDGASHELLQTAEFQVVLNANPRSRAKVEQGDYCLRTNPAGVDLNRNWDEKWQNGDSEGADTNGGPKPWSEPETRILKDVVSAYKPTGFVTVHSGTRGMYMPWAYDTNNLATRNQPTMMKILRDLDQSYCKCPFGAAGKEVGYACPGTSLDWVYDILQTPYSFAFEIFVGKQFSEGLEKRWKDKLGDSDTGMLLDNGYHLGHNHFSDIFSNYTSDFATGEIDYSDAAGVQGGCFSRFNPDSKEEYDSTVKNWAAAYLDMTKMIVALEEKQHGHDSSAKPVDAAVDESESDMRVLGAMPRFMRK